MTRSSDEDAIRALLTKLGRAIEEKDPDGALAPYAADVVRFDLAPPLALHGAKARDRDAQIAWFETWRGPIRTEARDPEVIVSGDLAVVYGLFRMQGTQDSGDVDLWFRQTIVLRKTGGGWAIVHEHSSTPFYMDGSMKAAVDLEP
jgi:ketosteroid isomerase-like protein